MKAKPVWYHPSKKSPGWDLEMHAVANLRRDLHFPSFTTDGQHWTKPFTILRYQFVWKTTEEVQSLLSGRKASEWFVAGFLADKIERAKELSESQLKEQLKYWEALKPPTSDPAGIETWDVINILNNEWARKSRMNWRERLDQVLDSPFLSLDVNKYSLQAFIFTVVKCIMEYEHCIQTEACRRYADRFGVDEDNVLREFGRQKNMERQPYRTP